MFLNALKLIIFTLRSVHEHLMGFNVHDIVLGGRMNRLLTEVAVNVDVWRLWRFVDEELLCSVYRSTVGGECRADGREVGCARTSFFDVCNFQRTNRKTNLSSNF